ncbi:MAG: 16S rRNA (guanine(966)-N(2))-methyltransferase RsmD [Clostridiales Family XIII bacterium]|jgi:16S rRNA (guanine966-N2)-methyltransferase|nr:16S rRNA (guanine(966)-N(2))-methyltransferase RsmD [Clostridiales Family XIII bacterium]
MRVIAGEFRGRRLLAPEGQDVRPTSDRVREAIFSMLGEAVEGASCLDLFAGTGALGIEALSRGATSCVFSDASRRSIALLHNNLKSLQVADRADVLSADYRQALRKLRDKDAQVGIAFVDPPYAAGYYRPVMQMLADYGIILIGGLVVVESDARRRADIDVDGFSIIREKTYGKVAVDIYEWVGV